MHQDQGVEAGRAEIAALDREILAALNRRVRLVRALKAHKERMGLPFHDPDQEARVLETLCAHNPGPLPSEGVRAVFGAILAWVKAAADRP